MLLSKIANNKGADQTVRMRRLVCACVVLKHPEGRFSRDGAQIIKISFEKNFTKQHVLCLVLV